MDSLICTFVKVKCVSHDNMYGETKKNLFLFPDRFCCFLVLFVCLFFCVFYQFVRFIFVFTLNVLFFPIFSFVLGLSITPLKIYDTIY